MELVVPIEALSERFSKYAKTSSAIQTDVLLSERSLNAWLGAANILEGEGNAEIDHRRITKIESSLMFSAIVQRKAKGIAWNQMKLVVQKVAEKLQMPDNTIRSMLLHAADPREDH